LRVLAIGSLFLSAGVLHAQSAASPGNYIASGLFYAPPPLGGNYSAVKTITKTGDNTYMADFARIGSLGYQFSFSIDATNHLVNWTPLGITPLSSGFMTEDNPGNVDYSAVYAISDTVGFNSAICNNTYDPATQTFYMHYGYVGGGAASTPQTAYTRQVYEKLALDTVRIFSFTPGHGAHGDTITISGKRFTGATSVSFGNVAAAQFWVLSDTVIFATLDTGATGAVKIVTPQGIAEKEGFYYDVTIAGPDSIKAESKTPVLFTVPAFANATYFWTVPPGSSIKSGQGTNAAWVLWGIRQGIVSVKIETKDTSFVVAKHVATHIDFTRADGDFYIVSLAAKLYPNPAKDEANLMITNSTGKVTVIITDVNGKTIKNIVTANNGSDSFLVSTSNLVPGFYIVTIRDEKNTKTLKLVKIK